MFNNTRTVANNCGPPHKKRSYIMPDYDVLLSNQRHLLKAGTELLDGRVDAYNDDLQTYMRTFIEAHGLDKDTITKNKSHICYLRVDMNRLELVYLYERPDKIMAQDLGTYTYANNGFENFTKKEHILPVMMEGFRIKHN